MTLLRQRMLHDMQIRNLADNTQKSYLLQVSSFARHFRRSPELLGPEEIRAWLVHLREERKLAPSSLGPTIGALRFLYRVTLKRPWSDEDFPLPKKPFRLPVVLSLEEITTFFESIASLKQRTILMTAYAAGLRVSEAVHLKVSDIDSQRMVIRVNQGKNRKDRYVMLSPRLLEILRLYWHDAHPREWLFPGDIPGHPITRSAVALACRIARRRSGIQKPITPHSLRHYVPFRVMSCSRVIARIPGQMRNAG
ncbi:tyrosine-type recombinase/integrase [Paraburkholderia aromaticivorans]|uniref:tyrosine-type recombinase/integrase n=1 Tax=Paraburkholderia aromaticivorans TaxID=2026199 RepID=UPI001F10F140|nr:site-specific integrase [Paraburkholderia aromaticivorans]